MKQLPPEVIKRINPQVIARVVEFVNKHIPQCEKIDINKFLCDSKIRKKHTPEVIAKAVNFANGLQREKLDIDRFLCGREIINTPVSSGRIVQFLTTGDELPRNLTVKHHKDCRIHFCDVTDMFWQMLENAELYNDDVKAKCNNPEKKCCRFINLHKLLDELPKRKTLVKMFKEAGEDYSWIPDDWDISLDRMRSALAHTKLRLQKQAAMANFPLSQECIFPRCAQSVRGFSSVIDGHRKCFSCGASKCQTCESWFGDQNPDLDHRDRTCNIMHLIRVQGLDAANEALLAQTSKKCPNCSFPTSKNGGCNHIHCRCGTHWCWKCRWHDSNGQKGIYDHLREAHN